MLKSLADLDPRIAAGVLAQTALHLECADDSCASYPALRTLVHNQHEIEKAILEELRAFLHLDPNDYSSQAVQTLAEAIDHQTDALIEAHQERSPVDRLSDKGLLQSDVFDVTFEQPLMENFSWRWSIESELALEAVKRPHKEQSLGQPDQPRELALVTIFARFFKHLFPARSFWMLVVGKRVGVEFRVSQVWRAYPAELDLRDCTSPLDVLQLLAEKFGHAVKLNGISGKFFSVASKNELSSAQHKIEITQSQTDDLTATIFAQEGPDGTKDFLIVPINLTKYFRMVDRWRGWARDVINQLDVFGSRKAANSLASASR